MRWIKDAYKNYHRYDQRDGRFDDGVIWRLSIFSHFKPVAEAVSKAYGVHGYLMDSYAMKAATQIALGDNFGYVGYVFVLAFLLTCY